MSTISSISQKAVQHWTAHYGKSIIFIILTMVAAGVYLAFSIPLSVFPTTDFPRIVIGADNGVAPIDQMLVTVTRPIEEAVNSVQGLEAVKSITSRGTARSIFFSRGTWICSRRWSASMRRWRACRRRCRPLRN